MYCTGLRASWSPELAYVRLVMSGHCLLQKRSPFSCAWPGIKRRRPRKFVIWRGGGGGRVRRGCREKGFSFSKLARPLGGDLLSQLPSLEGGGWVVSLCTPAKHEAEARGHV
jgi:hypothetical protein